MTLYYYLLLSCDFTDAERGAIALGFNDIEEVSCAKFRPATTADKVVVISAKGLSINIIYKRAPRTGYE